MLTTTICKNEAIANSAYYKTVKDRRETNSSNKQFLYRNWEKIEAKRTVLNLKIVQGEAKRAFLIQQLLKIEAKRTNLV